MSEPEHSAAGIVEEVATIFLTSRECPFRCLMCDLWQDTTAERIPTGSIPAQLDFALERLPAVKHVKLYNNGNFFDAHAIPTADHHAIATRLRGFRTVIVENHPALCSEECLRFRDRINAELEIAIGLETVHPEILRRLNKRMTSAGFARAARFLVTNGIHVRAFILLRPPYLTESEGVEWALRSIDFAFDVGARVCSVIPTRAGNGIIDQLAEQGHFTPPRIESLESVVDSGLTAKRGRVFADLWNVGRIADCDECRERRIERLRRMNLEQRRQLTIDCPRCSPPSESTVTHVGP